MTALAYELERIASRERQIKRFGLSDRDCGFLEEAAKALRAQTPPSGGRE